MSCPSWNEDWIAFLYDELTDEEAAIVAVHRAACAECDERLDALAATRRVLAESAPEVPAAPRVLVLRDHRRLSHTWSFAGGLAAAAAIFAVALTAWPRPAAPAPAISNPAIAARADEEPATPSVDAGVAERLARLERRMNAGAPLTRQDLDQAVAGLVRRLDADRAEDVEFLLGEIRAAEWRTGRELMTNREALRYAMLARQPGFSER